MVKKKDDVMMTQIAELKEQMRFLTDAVVELTAAIAGHKASDKRKEVKWTEDQANQRRSFATMIKVSSALKDVYKLGLIKKAARDKVQPRDLFKKLNKRCFEKEEVKWEKLMLSWGTVSDVRIKGAERTEEGKVRVKYESTGREVVDGDVVYVCTVSQETLKCKVTRGRMSEGEGEFGVPKGWEGGNLHIYAFAYSSADDRFSKTTYWRMED